MFSPRRRRRGNGAFAAALWAVVLLLTPSTVRASRLSSVKGALASPFRTATSTSTSSTDKEGGDSNSTSVPQQQAKRNKDLSSSKEIKFLKQQRQNGPQMTRGGAAVLAAGRGCTSTTRTRAVPFARRTATTNARDGGGGKHNRTTPDATHHTQEQEEQKKQQQQTKSSNNPAGAVRKHRRKDRARFSDRSECISNFHSILFARGGAAVICEFRFGKSSTKTPMSQENQRATSSSFAARNKRIVWTAIFCTLCYALFLQRGVWMPLLTDRQALQELTLSLLDRLKPDTDDPADWFRAYLAYGTAMAVWELLGLSTIPVETAAGMVFGFRAAAASSLAGKLCGALAAYLLGRKTPLRGWMVRQRAVQQSTILQLLISNSSSDAATTASSSTNAITSAAAQPHPPLLTAFLMKFSCFPEAIKNVGSSLIPVIQPWMFLLVTLVHGGAYTLLWTWLGVDTAARLNSAPNGDGVPTNYGLRVALIASVISGFVLTPLAMVWWVRDLQRKAAARQDSSGHFSLRTLLQNILGSMFGGNRQGTVANAKRDPTWTEMMRRWRVQTVAYWREISLAEIFLIAIIFALLVTTGVASRNSWSLASL